MTTELKLYFCRKPCVVVATYIDYSCPSCVLREPISDLGRISSSSSSSKSSWRRTANTMHTSSQTSVPIMVRFSPLLIASLVTNHSGVQYSNNVSGSSLSTHIMHHQTLDATITTAAAAAATWKIVLHSILTIRDDLNIIPVIIWLLCMLGCRVCSCCRQGEERKTPLTYICMNYISCVLC